MMDGIRKSAIIEGQHRYLLRREWGEGKMLTWCMLNPSTADADKSDPTLTRCMNFAKGWGYDGVELVNLFSWRSKDPRDVVSNLADASNGDTDRHIAAAAVECGKIVVGWGAYGDRDWVKERVGSVVRLLAHYGVDMWCVGKTKSGCPRHPLYVKSSAELVRWEAKP